jgi:hypothetical protein
MTLNSSKQDIIKFIKKEGYKVYGDFVNEFGEEFVVYGKVYANGLRRIYVTGDELNWETGWLFNNRKVLKQEFELNEEEFDMIKDIIQKSDNGTKKGSLGRIIANRLRDKDPEN